MESREMPRRPGGGDTDWLDGALEACNGAGFTIADGAGGAGARPWRALYMAPNAESWRTGTAATAGTATSGPTLGARRAR